MDVGDIMVVIGEDTATAVPFVGIGAIKSGVKAGIYADNWAGRGKYYSDYYKNTGKKPRYYNKVTRRRIKW